MRFRSIDILIPFILAFIWCCGGFPASAQGDSAGQQAAIADSIIRQIPCEGEGRFRRQAAIADSIIRQILPFRAESRPSLMLRAGLAMKGTPYVAGTLDGGEKEELRVYLDRTDCIIFVETAMNLAIAVKEYGEDADYQKLCDLVRESRYRGGKVGRYSDRLHYTTEWILQGEKNGIFRDITMELGGESCVRQINFMSRHFSSYPRLADGSDPEVLRDRHVIAEVGKELSSRAFSFIPESKVGEIEGQIRNGDIICFVSNVSGLDIAHVGMACVHDGVVGLLHASSVGESVEVSPSSISGYCLSKKNFTGIKVLRLL